MYKITINGATYPKVTNFRTSESKLGQRFTFYQANGVKISKLIKDIEKLEIEREEQCNESKEQSK